jgi:outer membrane protein
MKAILKSALAAAIVTLGAVPASAESGDWLVRLRGIAVAPTESSSAVLPTFPGATVGVETAFVPELDFTYFITKNIAAELILATSPHDIFGKGALAGLKIADTMALPPTLTVQYHFAPDAKFDPYLGVGANWTIFYAEDTSDALDAAIGATAISLSDSFNWAAQAGFNVRVSDRWHFNADVKFININTTATLRTGALVNTVDVDLDPIVAGIGFGYRF